jgi:hypothetical protein
VSKTSTLITHNRKRNVPMRHRQPVPSHVHEALLALFRNQPGLAPGLLRDALHLELPAYTEARIESADLTELQPAEYRADLVVLLSDTRPVLGIIVEAQLAIDERKRFSWPVYVVGLRARMRCPVCLFVVTEDEVVARWASKDIALGGGSRLRPFVLGPSRVPEVTDEIRAKSDPELAVLSARAHGRDADIDKAVRIASAALAATRDLDDERQRLYFDLVRAALSEAVKESLEAMKPANYEYQSDFARKYFAEGRAAGQVEGRAAGQVEGRAAGQAALLLKLLRGKFGPLPESAISRVQSAGLDELDRWSELFLSARSIDDVLR